MPAHEPARYNEGKDCPSIVFLMEFFENPDALDQEALSKLDDHLDACPYCSHQLEVAHRRECRSLMPVPPPIPETTPVQPSWFAWLKDMIAAHPNLVTAAALVVAVFLGSTLTYAAMSGFRQDPNKLKDELDSVKKENQNLRQRTEELKNKLDSLQPAAGKGGIDARQWEFQEVRSPELLLAHEGKPNTLGIKFRVIPNSRDYTGVDVVWDAEGPNPQREEVFVEGYVPFRPLITHSYSLPPAGSSRRIVVRLYYYTTGSAQREFEASTCIVESIPLVLSSDGIQMASAELSGSVTVEMDDPPQAQVGEDFRIAFRVRMPADAGEQNAGVLHVLVRPLDGSGKLRESYSVQTFRQALDDLRALGAGEHRFSTWVTLRGVLAQVPPQERESTPRRFEVLIVTLPRRVAQPSLPRTLLDLDTPQWRGIVKASCEVRLGDGPRE
jgi:hypothetical protein